MQHSFKLWQGLSVGALLPLMTYGIHHVVSKKCKQIRERKITQVLNHENMAVEDAITTTEYSSDS